MKLTCDQLDTLLSEFMDGTLTPAQEQAAGEHLATCRECSAELSQLQGVGELYRLHGRMQLSPEARLRIEKAIGLA
jgi:anti-sigma factor RsiW